MPKVKKAKVWQDRLTHSVEKPTALTTEQRRRLMQLTEASPRNIENRYGFSGRAARGIDGVWRQL